MLTVLHPEVKLVLKQFAGGLLPILLNGDAKLSLIVKTQKEAILAAKLDGGFSFYLPLLQASSGTTTAVISAFFDDADEPLVIRTPLFQGDELANEILALLKYDEVDIYFFDEHNYEWMAYKSSLKDGGTWLAHRNAEVRLLAYHPETLKGVHSAIVNWFGCRDADDDKQAIRVNFKNDLSIPDINVFDLTPETNDFIGGAGFRHDSLTREDPGYFQERDIAACLRRAFSAKQLIINPRRKDTYKEVLDHLVITESVAILVQAKDSPTTQDGLNRSISRKRRSTHKQIDDAIRQINGAAKYFNRTEMAPLVVGESEIEISLRDRKLIGLAIVKELFDDEGVAYVKACKKLSGLSGGGIVMDYNSLHAFSHHYSSEDDFTQALTALISQINTDGWIPTKEWVFDGVIDSVEKLRRNDL